MRIEVGYGLEGAITDAYSSRIINTIMTPEFKEGHFSDGIEKGTAAIVTLIAKEYNVTLTGVPEPVYQDQQGGSIWVLLFIFCILYLSFLAVAVVAGEGCFYRSVILWEVMVVEDLAVAVVLAEAADLVGLEEG